MKKFLLRTISILIILYVLGVILLYFFQENLIFSPQKLNKAFQFEFDQKFEEKNIKTTDGTILSGVLFKVPDSKGLIFYLHGNSGSINSCGIVAETFTALNYDVFMLDYRGYGKSPGSIIGEEQTHKDVQSAYNEMKNIYPEDKICVLGYSIGTGFASKLASENNPKLLILHAPYYNMTDLMRHKYPIAPTFILKYKLKTNEYLKECKMPVVIFHGDKDHGIYYGSSLKLKKEFKSQDTLITLHGQGHNGIIKDEVYQQLIPKLLNRKSK
ncbi:alpha/beta fold hydrolase [Fluviicola taffensis]|uniref:alpha/beta hydrolase n=1 Tax=Fluviicola taffensis TaxID=191579 RepID=UPI003137FA78